MQSILVVDDDQHLRELVTRFLAEHHYQVYQAHHGADAITQLEKYDVQAIIIDIM